MVKKPKYSEELVQRVNELFHDFEHDKYHEDHPEIMDQETGRWNRLFKQPLREIDPPRTIIDIGTGTGFVPLTIADKLSADDKIICSDISQKMLETAKYNIEQKDFSCQFEYIKIEPAIPLALPFETDSADIITLNSVLHHIHGTKVFLKEIDRILKSGGLVIIAHEPNSKFKKNLLLQIDYLILSIIFNFQYTFFSLAKKIGLAPILEKIYLKMNSKFREQRKKQEALTSQINDVLLKEHLIQKKLRRDQILKITDIKVFEGFDPSALFTNYEIDVLETYNHLNLVSIKRFNNKFIATYDRMLQKLYPNSGATFFAIYKKNRD